MATKWLYLFLILNVLQYCYSFILIDDSCDDLSTWPIRSPDTARITGNSQCGTTDCIRLGWNGVEGFVERTIVNIEQYTSFSFEMYLYLKSVNVDGEINLGDTCRFKIHWGDNQWITVQEHHVVNRGALYSPASLQNPGGKTSLTMRYESQEIEDDENCYMNDFKLFVTTSAPTPAPTDNPTDNPSPAPTSNPSPVPTSDPTPAPTSNPTISTMAPTNDPTINPSNNPTTPPTKLPTMSPTFSSGAISDIQTTDDSKKESDLDSENKKTSFIVKNLIVLILCISACIICGIVFVIIGYLKMQKKKARKDTGNMELETIVSTTSPNTEPDIVRNSNDITPQNITPQQMSLDPTTSANKGLMEGAMVTTNESSSDDDELFEPQNYAVTANGVITPQHNNITPQLNVNNDEEQEEHEDDLNENATNTNTVHGDNNNDHVTSNEYTKN